MANLICIYRGARGLSGAHSQIGPAFALKSFEHISHTQAREGPAHVRLFGAALPGTEVLAMLGTILLIILILLIIGALPTWGYSREWGYYPAGGLGLVLIIILILAFFSYIPLWG